MPLDPSTYGPRLEAAGAYVRDCQNLLKAALSARNTLIVEAIDAGFSGHQAAKWTKLCQPHVIRILSESQPDLPPTVLAE